jgi:acyl-CoA reductase-like NAD-dependent aldehyde dehydrogenase
LLRRKNQVRGSQRHQSYKEKFMEHKLWIDGKWEDTKGGKMMSIEDPTTGKEIAQVADASREDVDRAVQARRNAPSMMDAGRRRPLP